MFRSILTSAFRSIVRNKSFSIINLIGLSVSMSLGMLIIIIVKEAYTFDTFHRDQERIFRVNTRAIRVEGGKEPYASAPMPIGRALRDEYTLAEDVVLINDGLQGDATYGNVNVPLHGLMVDQSFLKVFNFQLEKGNQASALADPASLVLTHEAAEKIFGKEEPLGKTLTLGRYGEFVITGVLKKHPGPTHFDFEALGSSTGLPALEKAGIVDAAIDNWNNYYSGYVYFKLKEGKSEGEVVQALAEINKKYYTGLKLETRDKAYEFYLQALPDITPGPELSNQMGNGMPTFLLLFMGSLAAVVLIMSVFNFTNLMIAKSLSRAREIGVRKVVGAQRFQVFLQFVGETILFALIALAFSYIILQFLKSGYQQLPFNEEFPLKLKEDTSLYVTFIGFAVSVGFLAGLLPAGYLSAFRPAKVLKDAGNLKVYSKLTLRKILMITQFTFSVMFVIIVIIIYRQIDFMLTADYGINEKNILNVRLQGVEYETMANEMRRLPGVVNVGGVSHQLGTWADQSGDYKRNKDEQPFVIRDFSVDANYVDNLELKFLAGGNFDPGDQGVREKHIILNESALIPFGFADPLSAIGQPVYADDSLMLEVIGVVKDFHFRPLNSKIGPLALRYNTGELSFLSIKIEPEKKDEVVAGLQGIWKMLDPVHTIDWMMMDDEIDDAYRRAGFNDILAIVGYIAFLSVVLACLGMLGMAMYATQTRIKEVGVRKVMGASVTEVVVLLSRSFMILIGISVAIGTPISFFLGELFLNELAYKIEITPVLLLTGISIVAGLGLIVICSQTAKAAGLNPVRSLRYE